MLCVEQKIMKKVMIYLKSGLVDCLLLLTLQALGMPQSLRSNELNLANNKQEPLNLQKEILFELQKVNCSVALVMNVFLPFYPQDFLIG